MNMKKPSMKDLIRKRQRLLKKFEQHSELVRGSITSVCSTCSRAQCICEKQTTPRAYRLTYKDNKQKTHTVYIPKAALPKIRKMIANYAKSREIIEQLVETNIEMFKLESRS